MESSQQEQNICSNRICRICLDKVNGGFELFSEKKESNEILDKLYLCFQIILEDLSSLPNIICGKCNEELYVANNFRLKCITFEERFIASCQTVAKEKLPHKSSICNDESDAENSKCEFNCDTDEPDLFCTKNCNEEDTKLDTVRNVFKCETCGKFLKSKMSLNKHIISMHHKRKHIGKVTGTGSERRYHCTQCPYSTPHSQTLINHMRRHDGTRPYQCYCGKSFTQSSSLATHKKTHTDTKFYTCSICGKQFKHAFVLKNHQRVHETTGSFSCNICTKILKSKTALRSHILRHSNIRNYSCEACGATFVTSSELINHKKIHNKKTMECHLCGYKTCAKSTLVVHLKRHAGDKPYKCDLCSVALLTSSDLRRHRRVHTHEKPFTCPTCAQRFSHSSSLNKHIRNVHGARFKWSDIKPLHGNIVQTIKDENYE